MSTMINELPRFNLIESVLSNVMTTTLLTDNIHSKRRKGERLNMVRLTPRGAKVKEIPTK